MPSDVMRVSKPDPVRRAAGRGPEAAPPVPFDQVLRRAGKAAPAPGGDASPVPSAAPLTDRSTKAEPGAPAATAPTAEPTEPVTDEGKPAGRQSEDAAKTDLTELTADVVALASLAVVPQAPPTVDADRAPVGEAVAGEIPVDDIAALSDLTVVAREQAAETARQAPLAKADQAAPASARAISSVAAGTDAPATDADGDAPPAQVTDAAVPRPRDAGPATQADQTEADAAIQAPTDISIPVDDATRRASATDRAAPAAPSLVTEPGAPRPAPVPQQGPPAMPGLPPRAPEAEFARTNHPTILQGIRGQLLPDGGSMHLRLDPPELGALQVSVHLRDGVMTASFTTANEDAARLLSHSLSQLKHALEGQGVTVEKLHVEQSARPEGRGTNPDAQSQQRHAQDGSHQHEQQRREMLRRMWRRLSLGDDPLDLVA